MRRNNMIYKILTTWIAIAIALALPSCQDDPIYKPVVIPEGEVEISAEVSFRPLVDAVADQSRALGEDFPDGIDVSSTVAPKDQVMLTINKLTILFYDQYKNLIRDYSGPVSFTGSWEDRQPDNNQNETVAESRTPKATFKKRIESGIYYIFAVANMDVNLDEVETIDRLRSIKLSWVANSISSNIEMLGVFTTGEIDKAQNIGFEEDTPLTLTPGSTTLHAWARRAVSKVTIDFDGSQLRNNVMVFIKSARIVDIADGCYLGRTSKVGDSENGNFGLTESVHKIVYGKGTNYEDWPYVARGSKKFDSYVVGKDTVKFHSEFAYSLPCYENMQGKGDVKYQDKDSDGKIDYPNSGDATHPTDGKYHKDKMPNGTYIEVEGYYVSSNVDYISSGPITYRFMLGKNADDNYDIERNHHYKVTMAFRGNGNDVDWHVDYKEKSPHIYVNDVNCPYSYNEKVTIPVRITGGRVTALEATIIRNDWHPIENVNGNSYFTQTGYTGWSNWVSAAGGAAKYNEYFGDIDNGVKQKKKGFLTLYKPTDNVIVPYQNGKSGTEYNNSAWQTYAYLDWYWDGKMANGTNVANEASASGGQTIGHRVYTDGQYYQGLNGVGETTFQIEAYTRQKNLIKNTGYSGANIFETGNRLAQVELKATVEVDGITRIVRDTFDVEQSRRIVNPTGIYRSAENNAPFHVNLKYATVEPTTDENTRLGQYLPLRSRGPWRAVVENIGDPGMISLSQTWGDTDSEIDFTVNFAKTAKNPSFAIISIYYHNYSCHHRIFVRKGYGSSAVIDGGVKWHAGNVNYRANGKLYDVKDPMDEGSLFRYANLSYALATKNYHDFLHNVEVGNASLYTRKKDDADGNPTFGSVTWDRITSPKFSINKDGQKIYQYSLIEQMNAGSSTPTKHTTFDQAKQAGEALLSSMKTRPASFDDFYDLYKSPDIDYAYGVIYGDDATGVADNMGQAYGHDNDFVKQYTGMGMRCVIVYNKRDGRHVIFPISASGYGHRNQTGVLRYAGRGVLMNNDLAETRPVFWNIMYSKGAIYWLAMFDTNKRLPDGSGIYQYSTAWDMNYTSFDFYTYGTDASSTGSHAAYIRLVDKP
ncbi:MAG: hypothetical protein NC343_08280 [Muribaculum sp.]|nr:hypothetical protein [Muribaculaceae bacterium]MCM1081734.1 hypothetical protein [Muribaculum sp.]